MLELNINGETVSFKGDPDMPLLWALREDLQLTGSKFGCGIGVCGACTVHVDGVPTRSCNLLVSSVAGKSVTTIEGLAGGKPHPLQRAWIEENVPQCGYCQSGQIMAAAALLAAHPKPSEAEIERAMSGNLCRCGTYQRIRRAIHRAAGYAAAGSADGGVPAREGEE